MLARVCTHKAANRSSGARTQMQYNQNSIEQQCPRQPAPKSHSTQTQTLALYILYLCVCCACMRCMRLYGHGWGYVSKSAFQIEPNNARARTQWCAFSSISFITYKLFVLIWECVGRCLCIRLSARMCVRASACCASWVGINVTYRQQHAHHVEYSVERKTHWNRRRMLCACSRSLAHCLYLSSHSQTQNNREIKSSLYVCFSWFYYAAVPVNNFTSIRQSRRSTLNNEFEMKEFFCRE